jgi:DNA-binding MarR family transcriptional regulator
MVLYQEDKNVNNYHMEEEVSRHYRAIDNRHVYEELNNHMLYHTKREQNNDNNYDSKSKYISEKKLYIYKYVVNTPGVYLRRICKELGLAMGDTQYHLSVLEKEGRIKSRKISQHRHYYPITILGEQNELTIAFLRQETARDILIYLIEHPGSSQQDIANFKNVSAPTIKWHMSKLIESGIIIVTKQGKEVRYFIKDSKSLTYCLKNFMPNMWGDLADRFAELFVEISLDRRKEIKV